MKDTGKKGISLSARIISGVLVGVLILGVIFGTVMYFI